MVPQLREEALQVLSRAPFMEETSKRELKYKSQLFCILKFLSSQPDKVCLAIIKEQLENENFLKQFHTRGHLPCPPFGNA